MADSCVQLQQLHQHERDCVAGQRVHDAAS